MQANSNYTALQTLRQDILKAISQSVVVNVEFTMERDTETFAVKHKIGLVEIDFKQIKSSKGLTLRLSTSVRTKNLNDTSVCPPLYVTLVDDRTTKTVLFKTDCRRLFWKQKDALLDISEKIRVIACEIIARRMCTEHLRSPVSELQEEEEESLLNLYKEIQPESGAVDMTSFA